MPSANLSSKLSPVCAEDVYEEFKNNLKIIINGGKSRIGIESTVIDLIEKPRILRPGIISQSDIQKFLRLNIQKKKNKSYIPWNVKKTLFTWHTSYNW